MRRDRKRRDNRAFWTQHEDELLRAYRAQGLQYTEIVRHMQLHGYNRTDQSLGNRHQQLMRLDGEANKARDAEVQRLALHVRWV